MSSNSPERNLTVRVYRLKQKTTGYAGGLDLIQRYSGRLQAARISLSSDLIGSFVTFPPSLSPRVLLYMQTIHAEIRSMPGRNRKLLRFALIGFLLGLCFPVAATIYGLGSSGQEISLSAILALHLNQPLYWIIDFAPLVLAVFSALIGIQSQRLKDATLLIGEQYAKQTTNIRNELEFFQALIQNAPFAVAQLDNDHRVLAANPGFEELFGFSEEEIIGRSLDKMISPDELYRDAVDLSQEVISGNIVRKISKRKRKNGSLVDVEIVGMPVIFGGESIGAIGLYHDVSARIEAEEAVQISQKRFRSLFDDSPISLWEEDFSVIKALLDSKAEDTDIIEELTTNNVLVQECSSLVKILDVNQATLDLLKAQSKDELLGGLPKILTEQSLDPFRNELIALVRGASFFETDIYQKQMDGGIILGHLRLSLVPGYEDNWGKVIISILDITERKQVEEKLRFMSFNDALTGLCNRAFFEEEMARLEKSRQYPIGLIVCDVDGLKQINDLHGHQMGDRAIVGAAQILKNVFRDGDIVARIGGDEFAILLPNAGIENKTSIETRIQRAITAYNQDDGTDDLHHPLSISFGFVIVQPGESLLDGYKLADEQMYLNKATKKK